MSESSKDTSSGGISTVGLLGIVFVVLKLTGYIDWSWWWVTCPFWGGLALLLSIALFALFGAAIVSFFMFLYGLFCDGLTSIRNNFKRRSSK